MTKKTNTKTNRITLKQIDAQIGTFSTNRDKLRQLGHEIGMLILRHAAPVDVNDDCQGSGDCTRAIKLTKEMPKSWAAQMELWFKEFSPIVIVTKNDKCEFSPAYKRLTREEKLKGWNLEDAAQTPFWELNEEPEAAKPLDYEALVNMIAQLGKRISKKLENGEVKPEDEATARNLSERLASMRIKRIEPETPANTTADEDEETGGVSAPTNKAAA